MKIEVLQENLQKALSSLQRIIPTKPSLPILSSVLFQVSEDTITLSATDLYIGIKTTVLGTIHQPGSIAIPGKLLVETINALHPGQVTLEVTDTTTGTVHITTQDSSISLQCQASDDYPPFPEITGDPYQLPWTQLETSAQLIHFAVSPDVTRPVLTSVLYDIGESETKLVGTDGFRLALYTFPNDTPQLPQRLLVPVRALQEVHKIGSSLQLEKVDFTVSSELKHVFFELAGTILMVRLIDGEYPPYEKIIPTAFTSQVLVDSQELLHHLKRAMIFARDASNIVHFEITPDQLVISATSPAAGKHQSSMAVKVLVDQPAKIAFNAKYLMDFVTAVKGQHIWFGMSESLKPAMFRPEGLEQYSYVVMPFRVNE